MTIPVNRLKLMAFAFGAMVAALAGTIFAAQQISVFPTNFDTPILILVYAGLILGGAGSIAGAATGALVVMVIYDGLLRSPTDSGYLFYGLILLTLLVKLRPWRKLGLVLAATAAFGFAAHAIAGAISSSAVAGRPASPAGFGSALRDWVIVPANPQIAGNWGFVLLVCMLIALVQVKTWWRTILLVPTLYLACFVWETRLARRAVDYPAADDWRHPDRDDERPATGAARRAQGGDSHVSEPSAQSEPPTEPPALSLDQLSLSFGGLAALSGLDLEVTDGEIVSLIGPNGAGKTTVFNVITGVYLPSSGDVLFRGRSIAGQPPHRIARRGIARTFQSLRLFLNMSVIENVMAATYGNTRATPVESVLRLPWAVREERRARLLAEEVLTFFGQRLAGTAGISPRTRFLMPTGAGLEIARALATRPRLLLLDEPAAGMNPAETHEITELIGRGDELGVAVCVIEHDMHVVAGCSDRVIALDHGVKIAEGSFDEVANDPAVVEAYMGRDPEALAES